MCVAIFPQSFDGQCVFGIGLGQNRALLLETRLWMDWVGLATWVVTSHLVGHPLVEMSSLTQSVRLAFVPI